MHAPFDGQLGIRQVNVGQMINAGQQVVPLTALDPVYVDFALPQQELSKLSQGLEVRVHDRRDARQRIQRQADCDQLDGRFGDAECHGASDAREP